MSRSKMYGALSFMAVLHEGSGFLGPALQAAGDRSPAASGGGLGTTRGGVKRASRSDLGVALSRTSLVRSERGGVVMMAKKRRRRRVDGAQPASAPAATTPPPKTAAAASPGPKQEKQDAEEEEEEEDGIALPPMPSELGRGAVMAAQKLQGEDMLSPAAFQPKPEVSDLEMAGGVGLSDAGLLDEPSTERKRSKYSGFDLDVELPMESESRETGKGGLGSVMSPDGVMPLPDFKELAKKPRKKERQKKATEVEEASKVERGNVAAFTKLLELDPEADSEDALFTTESYDAFSSILGEGKPFVGIDNSYLQSGHTVLLALVLVCAFIDLPGFPLTSLPYDVREFLKTGMLVVYAINAAIAYLSYLEAKRVGQPAGFWAFKGFVLGGLSFNELSQIEPRKIKPAKGGRERRG